MSLLCAPWTEAREMIRNFFQPVVNSDDFLSPEECDRDMPESHEFSTAESNMTSNLHDPPELPEGDPADRWQRPVVFANNRRADSESFQAFAPLLPFPYNSVCRGNGNQSQRKHANYHSWLSKQHRQAGLSQHDSAVAGQDVESDAERGSGGAMKQNVEIDSGAGEGKIPEEEKRSNEENLEEELDGFEPYHTDMVLLSALMLPYVSSVIVPLLQQRE